jgi:hypothetical protein
VTKSETFLRWLTGDYKPTGLGRPRRIGRPGVYRRTGSRAAITSLLSRGYARAMPRFPRIEAALGGVSLDAVSEETLQVLVDGAGSEWWVK